MPTRSWTDNDLITAVNKSHSIASVLRHLNFPTVGSYYHHIKKHMKRLNLTLLPGKDKTIQTDKSKLLNNSFTQNSILTTRSAKLRLLKDGSLPYKCALCNIQKWKDEAGKTVTLSLHLDHINGINNDYRLENLRFLCPNCHSLTNTYCGKNVKVTKKYKICAVCTKDFSGESTRCSECLNKLREARKWPLNEKLLELLTTKSVKEVAKELEKTPDSIYEHLRAHGLLEAFRKIQSQKEGYVLRKRKNYRSVYVPVGKSSCPPKEVLQELLWKYSTVKIATMYSVSDSTISKWAKKYNLSKPPRGYWAKQYSISGRQKGIEESV